MSLDVDPVLLEMFAAEVEVHMAALNDGLLALEQNPHDNGRSEALMRAAHSIKGAARLVGLQAAVDVAHVIEDCFVAAREGRLAMSSGLVDVLLAGVDLLGKAAQFDVPAAERVSAAKVAETIEQIVQAQRGRLPEVQTPQPAAAVPSASDRSASVGTAERRVLVLSGALDDAWVQRVHREIYALLAADEELQFDLQGVTDIGPLGLALLTQAAQRGGAGQTQFANVPAGLARLWGAVGLDSPPRTPGTEGRS